MLANLPLNVLNEICIRVSLEDLTSLAIVNKSLRVNIYRISPDVPALYPLDLHQRRSVEVKLVKTLVLNSELLYFNWTPTVFKHFKNVETIEIPKIIQSRKTINNICRTSTKYPSIKTILVRSSQKERWRVLGSKVLNFNKNIDSLPKGYDERRKEILAIDQSSQYSNPLLKYVPRDSIVTPTPQPSWMAIYPELISHFNDFRSNSIQKLEKKPKLDNLTEALGLNGIMLIAPGEYKKYNIDQESWENLVQIQRERFLNVSKITEAEKSSVTGMIDEFSQTALYKTSKLTAVVNHLREQVANKGEYEMVAFKMIENIAAKVNDTWCTDSMTEDTLTMIIVDPVLNAYIDPAISRLTLHGKDHELTESKERKILQAIKYNEPTANIKGRFPDRSGQIICNDEEIHHTFLCEIKAEKESKKRPDLAKLGTMMKDCVDKALKRVKNPMEYSVVGLLVEGRKCCTYTLYSPFIGLYLLIEMHTFRLPTDLSELNCLMSIAPALYYCRKLIEKYIGLLLSEEPENDHSYEYRLTSKSPKQYHDYYV